MAVQNGDELKNISSLNPCFPIKLEEITVSAIQAGRLYGRQVFRILSFQDPLIQKFEKKIPRLN